jgi:hypothetical protein
MRRPSLPASRNSSTPLLPASTSSPSSTLRAVITPSKGATIRLNAASFTRRCSFAAAASSAVRRASASAITLVRGLARDELALDELLPAFGGALRDRMVRPARLEFGARLRELLVELGRVELRQQLPGGDAAADVDREAPHIARAAGVQARLRRRGDGGRQHERVVQPCRQSRAASRR